ncbi:3'(2'),5'-bisphosphate nucleotidase CysQ [Sphingomonas sp.]|uniref:3'(2'),5'-bisphosphate nucleotidase CysQ n=1 Tax=Sphingomonas sp. TaxID=28214 RepID=UPI003AFF6B61
MPETLVDAVTAAAAEAGQLALAKAAHGVERWEKAGGEPVCEADLAIDALLRERLAGIDADAGWLSEETADNTDRLKCDRLWVVDPIDGTRDYLRGRPGWAVSVALIERGRPLIGVLEAPARGERWVARAGLGATRNGLPVQVAARHALAGARVPADRFAERDHDLVPVPRPNSIALRIAMVASGEADLVATIRWGHEWDVAAAVLIAEEAGATVSDAAGRPLAFNTPSAEAFGVLVTAPGIHAAAVERLATYPEMTEKLGRAR